jgi:phenylpropionate dioxygenase-like ring-hydroxylating dioxygenase large terminal subunit
VFDGAVSSGLLDQWYVVADGSEVMAEPVAVRVLGRSFVLWRAADGSIAASTDRCPHREAPLSAGRIDEGCIVCPYHGWTFEPDGACSFIPSAGPNSPTPPTARLDIVAVTERYGVIWLSPGEPDAGVGIPQIEQDQDESFARWTSGIERWTVSASRMTDNFCDVAHFPFVHAGTIGSATDPVVGPVDIGELGDGFVGYGYSVDVDDETGQTIRQDMSTGYHLPFTVRSNTRYATGGRAGQERVLLLCTTPIDDAMSLFSFIVWRNHDHAAPASEVLAFDRAIGAEDQVMLERIPGVLPLDQSQTVSVQSDRLSVRWRRALRQLVEPG